MNWIPSKKKMKSNKNDNTQHLTCDVWNIQAIFFPIIYIIYLYIQKAQKKRSGAL